MKRLIFTSIFLLGISLLSFSKVIRVNNMEPTNSEQNTYDNLQDAYNSTVSGDTLYIEGSETSYGSLAISKRLVFIGTGFFLSENPGLSANKLESIVHQFTFSNGSSGSKVIGLKFDTSQLSRINLSVENIEISNCYFRNSAEINFNANNLENVVIQGNIFINGNPVSIGQLISPPLNLIFSNNIVLGNFTLKDQVTGIITNNVFTGNTFNVGENSNLQIHNNILLGTSSNNIVMPEASSNISHNISVSDQFPNSNSNQPNTVAADIFITGDNTSDGKYKIRESGPADGTGRNGADIGPFGGARPYRLSGLPEIPVVYDFSTDGFGNSDGKLPITVKVRSN
jgi:hypothetical protein